MQTVKKGDLFFIRPNDMHSYSFFHSENFCVRNLGFSTQVLRNVSLFLEQEEKMDKLINSEMPSWLSELLLNMSKIENLQEGYERMCELAPCSPSHLCRLMKQISGKTPTQYINQERLKYAVYLLAQTDREILDICECCGFSNVSHFYHLFREQFGVSPAKFRKTV